jgi:hypothetical protein
MATNGSNNQPNSGNDELDKKIKQWLQWDKVSVVILPYRRQWQMIFVKFMNEFFSRRLIINNRSC